MKTRIYLTSALGVLVALFGFSPSTHAAEETNVLSIVPNPVSVERQKGEFELDTETRILLDSDDAEMKDIAGCLRDVLKAQAGILIAISPDPSFKPESNSFWLTTKASDPALGPEGYSLEIAMDSVVLRAPKHAGLFYGVQTLRQLIPVAAPGQTLKDEQKRVLPCVRILDHPQYAWRGLLLDVSRHFFPKAFIKQYIDYLAMNKLNTFHWHLTDSQGWRIEIKKYPKLTEAGAWRADRSGIPWGQKTPEQAGEARRYGGFYTQDDIREIVAYARSRYVTIVPEIEMPGHTMAALVAYPQFSCEGGPYPMPAGKDGAYYHNYCAGNDTTFAFLEDVLTEVMALFPSEFIHVGGDEVDKAAWKKCPKCQARIKAEGLRNENELQSYFIKRMEKFLASKGKRLVGWDEILEGGIAPGAVVMSWRGIEGGVTAAKSGHDVIMSPNSFFYLDLYQSKDKEQEPPTYGLLPLAQVYKYDSDALNLSPEESRHVLGLHGCLWTESVETPKQAEYMLFPRLFAVAEKAWSPKARGSDYSDFLNRLTTQYDRLDAMGINYRDPDLREVKGLSVFTTEREVEINPARRNSEIHCTLDGTEPMRTSPKYTGPIFLRDSAVLRVREMLPTGRMSKVQRFVFERKPPK